MKTTNRVLGWPLLLVILSFFFLATSCKSFKELTLSPTSGTSHPPYVDSQVLIWKAPGARAEDFNTLIGGYLAADPAMRRSDCGSCDANMVILQSVTMAGGGGLVGQLASNNPTGDIKPSGGGGTIAYWSFNFHVTLNDPINEKNMANQQVAQPKPQNNNNPDLKPIVVAVFDSGLDPGYVSAAGASYSNPINACIGVGSNNGWNIPDHTPDVRDNFAPAHGHGKHVAALSIQKSVQANLNPISILPVKFISGTSSTLYDVLCGIAYASERGADILNASFGYYASKWPGVGVRYDSLFKNYLKYYTLDKPGKKMIVVAAAGNEDDPQQLRNCGMISRNLDDVYFFPASFAESADMPNILVVTTVGEDPGLQVSPRQNYSSNLVSIGVVADEIQSHREFLFETPYNGDKIQGSSYATPLFTGLLAAHLANIKRDHPANYFDKTAILSYLAQHSAIQIDPDLNPVVKDGYYIRH